MRNPISRWRQRRPQKKDINTWFSFSYVDYLVLPRVLLQSMPPGWQADFVRLLEEFDAAFDHVDQPEYRVYTGEWVCVEDCDAAMLRTAGVTRVDPPMPLRQAMNIVERFLIAQGVGWEFTMMDLHEKVGDTVGKSMTWFRQASNLLRQSNMIEPVDTVQGLYRTTERVLDATAALGPMAAEDFPEPVYYWEGQELHPASRVFVPGPDTLPGYDRGRTHVAPYGGDAR